jgi:hypothetical protein
MMASVPAAAAAAAATAAVAPCHDVTSGDAAEPPPGGGFGWGAVDDADGGRAASPWPSDVSYDDGGRGEPGGFQRVYVARPD